MYNQIENYDRPDGTERARNRIERVERETDSESMSRSLRSRLEQIGRPDSVTTNPELQAAADRLDQAEAARLEEIQQTMDEVYGQPEPPSSGGTPPSETLAQAEIDQPPTEQPEPSGGLNPEPEVVRSQVERKEFLRVDMEGVRRSPEG